MFAPIILINRNDHTVINLLQPFFLWLIVITKFLNTHVDYMEYVLYVLMLWFHRDLSSFKCSHQGGKANYASRFSDICVTSTPMEESVLHPTLLLWI